MVMLFILGFLSYLFPKIDEVAAQKILESLLSLNGVLFGFTAVMVSLFLRQSIKLTDKTLKRAIGLSLVAFFCFIFSISLSFLTMGLGQEYMEMHVFTPVFATIAGAVCASVTLLSVFTDEYYPPEKAA